MISLLFIGYGVQYSLLHIKWHSRTKTKRFIIERDKSQNLQQSHHPNGPRERRDKANIFSTQGRKFKIELNWVKSSSYAFKCHCTLNQSIK